MFRRALLRLLAWLVPLGASALVAAFGTRDPADLPYFAHAARTLFSSRWADTFADPSLQVGPLQLVLVGICDRIGGLGFLAYAVEIALAAFPSRRLPGWRPSCSASPPTRTAMGIRPMSPFPSCGCWPPLTPARGGRSGAEPCWGSPRGWSCGECSARQSCSSPRFSVVSAAASPRRWP